MSEIQKPAKVVHLEYLCDHCGEANMVFSGRVLTSNPPKYPHYCPKCDHGMNLSKTYPSFGFIAEEE